MSGVRWYNRVAAWVYDLIGDRLIALACPAWEEQADREIAEERGYPVGALDREVAS